MANKKSTKSDQKVTRIVIEMPEEDGIQRNGTVIASRGEHAVIQAFTYAYAQEAIAIHGAVEAALDQLNGYESNPIELPDSKTLKERPVATKPAGTTVPAKKEDDTPDWMKPAFGKGAKKFAPTPKKAKR